MSTEIRKLKKEGVDFYPLIHEDAVVGNEYSVRTEFL